MNSLTIKTIGVREVPGSIYCPLCTHTVAAQALATRKGMLVKPGQKCPRCNTSLDAGYVMDIRRAAA